ncbi:MAG: serine/threonine-protein kinase [Gemmatimonadota bacterium]|nr:serine/threonine-protein kinase [Gemmatimonadota bacterium]
MSDILEQLKRALADDYGVDRLLGEGGMAIVFLARDVKHDREVAVKVLKPELAASLGADRFLREIQVTAKLQHPHILPLYDSGDADGLLYYVMPYVVGESLSDLLERETQLGLEDAVRIAREVAEALAYAHSYGLVHRDIKPDNVMMSNGHAIVADFGIARALSEAGADKLTQTGMSVGTPAYMSPEQAAGDPGVDARADIYSLGCMLYEMLVGQVPFTGPTAMAIMARHTMDHVTPPSIMRQSIPPELEDIVLRAMEKVPADRYRTAHEVVEALKAVERGEVSGLRVSTAMRMSRAGMRASQVGIALQEPPAPRRRWPYLVGVGGAAVLLAGVGWLALPRAPRPATSGELDLRRIAVTYFDDLSGDGQLGYLADGLTEGLIGQLDRVPGLDVVSRNGVAAYRGSSLPRDSIARALGAGTLLIGSVEPAAAGRVRVTTRLVDGASGADVGRRTSFEVPGDALLGARDSIARDMARTLREWLGQEVELRDSRAGTASLAAWTGLQRGERLRKEAEARIDAGAAEAGDSLLIRADSVLAEAEAADSRWVEPLLARGWVAARRAAARRGEGGARAARAGLELADRALAMDGANAGALELRGTLRYQLYNLRVTTNQTEWEQLLRGAREDLEAATRADPSRASAWVILSEVLYESQIDDVPGALVAARRGYDEDAFLKGADQLIARMFWASLDLEQFAEARRWCADGAARFPDRAEFRRCQLWLMAIPATEPDVARAQQLLAELDRQLPDSRSGQYLRVEAQAVFGGILGRAGLRDSAERVLARARGAASYEIDPEQSLIGRVGYMYSLAGDADKAIDLIKQYVAANPHHAFLESMGTVWWYRDLRQHPRWAEIEEAGR